MSVESWIEITVWLEDVGVSVGPHVASGVDLGAFCRAMTCPKISVGTIPSAYRSCLKRPSNLSISPDSNDDIPGKQRRTLRTSKRLLVGILISARLSRSIRIDSCLLKCEERKNLGSISKSSIRDIRSSTKRTNEFPWPRFTHFLLRDGRDRADTAAFCVRDKVLPRRAIPPRKTWLGKH